MELLSWLENNGFITWVRESDSQLGYTLYLAFHTIGMVALVGPSLVIAARVLGLAPRLPLRPLRAYRPVMTFGFWVTMVTGTVLFATAPVSYVQNVVFIVKIASLLVALIALRIMVRELFDGAADPDAHPVSAKARGWTVVTLLMWTVGVVAGRLTAYSGIVVIESLKAFGAVIAAVAVVAVIVSLFRRPPAVERTPSFTMDIQPTPVKGGK